MRVNFLGLKCFLSLFVGFLLTPLTTTYAQMTVNDQLTAQQLVEALIGSGITPSNVSFQGTTQMAGSFQKNNSTFNFERGILLTSGSSAGAVGANNSTSAGVNRSLSGHQLITNLVAPYTSYDACALQFDFYPSTNTVSFNYIFGSEEYDEFVCTQFIDAFGFFVTGANPAGGQYTDANMALVPGTSTYVGVNTVNNGKPGDASCIPQNTTHYRSNTSGTEFQYDAFTRVMPVSFNVVPGQLYTIKLIIADAGNGTYDSGVFIEGGSFTSCPAPTVTNGTRCGAGAVALSASGTTNGNYRWYTAATGGTAITGEVNSTYNANVTQTTTYYVSIVNNSGTASCESNRVAVTATVTTATAPSTTGAAICGTGSVTLAASGGTNGQYRWYTVASGGTAISGATNSTYTTPSITQTTNYYVSIASSATCESARTSVVARVNPLPNNLTPPISLVTQNFKTFAAATENLQYSVNNVPPLVSGVTDTKHSIIIQTAPQMADATTGLPAPDWTKKTETVLDFPSTTPLTVGTRTVLLSSLVTQTEQPKNIFWRVGLRYKLAEGTNQPVSWSDLYSFQLTGTAAVIPSTNLQAGDTSSTQHTNKINWVYEVTYLDDNKTSQHISYADGLMKTRQQQVLVSSNTTYKVLCNETVYSEEGGGVVNTMGAPKTTAPLDKFSYDYRFFDVKSGSTYSDFTTRHFDAEQTVAGVRDIIPATPIDTTAGVGSYYRNASTMESHVDDAKGYPYSYSVGYKDPLNRLMVSAGTGETFRMGGGKETKFSSGSVGYNELKRVYGREGALKLKNITKSLTTDPNGVGVVSYTDDEGKTIATALTTCNAPVGTQDALVEDGMANFVAEYNILANNVLNDEALSKASSSSFILTCAQADVNVHYEIDQATFLSGLTATTCKSCEYDLKIKIVENANGRVVKDTVRAMPMTALTCGQTNKYVLDFVVKPGKAGSYTVYRTLKPRVNAVTGRTVVEEAIANYTESFKTDTLTKRNAFAAKYYGKDEWYAMRKMKLAGNRPQQVKNCLSSFVSSSAIPYRPWAIDVSKTSNSIFINDYFFIRKITSAGVVSNVFSQSGIKDATVDDEDNVFFVINNSVYKIAKGATTESLIYNATSVKGIKYFNNSLYLRIPATGNTSKTTFIKVSVTGTVLKNDFLPSGSELPFASTELDSWTAVSIDNKGNEEIYVSSKTQNLIYKIANGGYSIFAGTGTAGSVNGHRTTAQLRAPAGLAFDKAGNLFVSEHTTIRKIDMSTGIVTTYAGVNGTSAFVDGPLEGTTSLKGPQGIAFDAANNLFIADDTRISKIGACGIASNCNEVLPSKAQVTFSNSGVKTLVLQPNAREGKDADVRTSVSKPNNQITNYSNIDFTLFTEGTGKSRSLIQFDLSQIPTNAQIINSTLSFYESKSDVFDTCALFLRKITAAWQENSVTWSNQPAFTTTNQVSVPAANGDVSLDLTKIVQESVTTPAQNFGYMLMLQNEAFSGSTKAKYYGSSDNRNAKSRPRLEITYIVPQSTCANLSTLTDYATVTLNLTPPTDKTGTPVAIGQAKWSKGMTNESFTTALATSVNGNYNSNNLGFKTSNNLGLGYSNQVNNTLSFNAAVGSGSRYNGWTIKPTISYTTGIDPACFAISPTNIIPFTGGYSQGQCDEYVWVADKVSIKDVQVSGVNSKKISEFDGIQLSPLSRESYTVNASNFVSTGNTVDSIKYKFINAMDRMHWLTIKPTDITAMTTYNVSTALKSGYAVGKIPALSRTYVLNTSDMQDYYLVNVKYKGPTCEQQCKTRDFKPECKSSCEEQYKGLQVELASAYDTITKLPTSTTFTEEGTSNLRTLQWLVDNKFPFSYGQQGLIYDKDQVDKKNYSDLYFGYLASTNAVKEFDMKECLQTCNMDVTTVNICKTCNGDYNGCVYEYTTQLANGHEYFMDQWSKKGKFPFFTNNTAPLFDTLKLRPTATEYNSYLRDSLGAILFDHLFKTMKDGTADTVLANWMQMGETSTVVCTNCAPSGNNAYSCFPGKKGDLAKFPTELIPVLQAANAKCITNYDECLLKANDFELYLCQQNRENCIANAKGTAAEIAAQTTQCQAVYNCDVLTAKTDTIQRKRVIYEMYKRLYVNSDSIRIKTDNLFTETQNIKFNELILLLPDREIEERCKLECRNYFEIAYRKSVLSQIDSTKKLIESNFKTQCYRSNEKLNVKFNESLYHYTLYNYNPAGQLVSTVPPEGVDYINLTAADSNRAVAHRMLSTYSANSLGQLQASTSPDGGTVQHIYDNAGRLRFIQNAEQKQRSVAQGRQVFSYSRYNRETGKLIETGEYNAVSGPAGAQSSYEGNDYELFDWAYDYQISTTQKNTGTKGLRLKYAPTQSWIMWGALLKAPIKQGEVVSGEIMVKNPASTNTATLVMQFVDAAGNSIQWNEANATVYGSWQQLSIASKTAPAGAAYVHLQPTARAGTDSVYFDDIKLTFALNSDAVAGDLNGFKEAQLNANNPNWPSDLTKTKERNNYFYDQSHLALTGYTQRNLDQRVSKVSNDNANTYFSYDGNGRVKFVVQELLNIQQPSQRMKTIEYHYAPVSGQVRQVVYQSKASAEKFIHRYTYDSDTRFKSVEVSRDSVTWAVASNINYYLHGSLKSNTLGDDIQRLDYVYNLQNWLKSINHPIQTFDPSRDGISPSTVSKDVFAHVVHYYSGDYQRKGKGLDNQAIITPGATSQLKTKGKDLFNGIITGLTSYTGFDQTSSTTPSYLGQGFKYDHLYRLKGTIVETKVAVGFTGWTSTATAIPNIFQENLTYDANGNIQTLTRTSGNATNAMDNMDFKYNTTLVNGVAKKVNNKLMYIDDPVDAAGLQDLTDQNTGNYEYDANGRMIKDAQNEIQEIKWNRYNRVAEVIRTPASSKPRLRFTYDASGKRLSKTVVRSLTDSTQNLTSYYVYDFQGNNIAVYEKEFMSNIDYKLVIKDQPIYGQTKAGFYNNENTVYSTNGSTTNTSFQKSKLSFELTDHLGNVRALVSGVKKSSGMADVQSLKDYYPFGMPMYSDAVTERSRVFNSPTSSRYEFNGKEEDAETNSYDFGARAYDSRVGRWWSVEPLSYRYPGLSSYAFVANNPVNAIDPDGRKIIFVNGYWARGIIGWVFGSKQPGKEYWGDNFEKAAAKFFGDNSGFNEWVDASSTFGGDMSGDERYAAGYIYAMDNYDALIDNMTADEVFNIVTHSEGAAHGAGMAQYLIEKGHTVKTVVHLSADEGDEFTTPDEPETYQMAYEGDWVTGNKKITGSDRYEVINRPDLGWQHVHGTTKSASVFGYVTTMRNQANTIKLKTKETNSSGSRSNKGGKKSTDTNYSKIDSSGKVKKK